MYKYNEKKKYPHNQLITQYIEYDEENIHNKSAVVQPVIIPHAKEGKPCKKYS